RPLARRSAGSEDRQGSQADYADPHLPRGVPHRDRSHLRARESSAEEACRRSQDAADAIYSDASRPTARNRDGDEGPGVASRTGRDDHSDMTGAATGRSRGECLAAIAILVGSLFVLAELVAKGKGAG